MTGLHISFPCKSADYLAIELDIPNDTDLIGWPPIELFLKQPDVYSMVQYTGSLI